MRVVDVPIPTDTSPEDFFKVGDKVRIAGGPMDGTLEVMRNGQALVKVGNSELAQEYWIPLNGLAKIVLEP